MEFVQEREDKPRNVWEGKERSVTRRRVGEELEGEEAGLDSARAEGGGRRDHGGAQFIGTNHREDTSAGVQPPPQIHKEG